MNKSRKTLALWGAPLGALAICSTAQAQTAPPAPASTAQKPASSSAGAATLSDVIVTAQRRSQNLQNVPVAVTSLSPQAMERQQITTAVDIARVVPNMFASNNVGQASANVYYIRGLGQTQSFPTFEPQVATYVDDIYIGRQNANNLALFGIDQVQVLRGPQGTLFGRNSTGGAVLVTLEKPGSEFGGSAEASYGSWNRVSGKGSVDIPVSESFRTRTSIFGVADDGYVEDLTTHQHLNDTHSWGLREAVTVLPADHVRWDASVDYSDANAANVLNVPGPGGIHGANRVSYSGFSTDGGALKPFLTGRKGELGQGVDVKSWGLMSNLQFDFDAGTLNLITGFRGLSQETGVDFPLLSLGPAVPFDQVPTGQFTLAQALRSSQYSQEVKWNGDVGSRVKYTTGVFVYFETNRNNFGAVANLGPLFGTTDVPFPLGDEFTKNDTTSLAAYAQGDYKATDKLTVTLGGRLTHERKTLDAIPNTPAGFTTEDIRAQGYKTVLTTDQFTPRLAVQYQWSPDVMLFASATRGFQGGGWNGLAFNAKTFNNFGPETVWSYEAGLRSENADRTLRFNANVFYEDVKHYQLLSDLASAGSFVTNNAADLESYGAEFELTWRPIDHLTTVANVGLQHGRYHNPSSLVVAQELACRAAPGPANPACGAGIVTYAGDLAPPSYIPSVTFSGLVTYDWMFTGFTLTPTLGVQWYSRQAVGTEGIPQSFQKAYGLLDLGLTYKPDNARWSATVECKNCTQVDYRTTYLFGYNYYNVPGQWDVRIDYRF